MQEGIRVPIALVILTKEGSALNSLMLKYPKAQDLFFALAPSASDTPHDDPVILAYSP
jgi:hypothetical protein